MASNGMIPFGAMYLHHQSHRVQEFLMCCVAAYVIIWSPWQLFFMDGVHVRSFIADTVVHFLIIMDIYYRCNDDGGYRTYLEWGNQSLLVNEAIPTPEAPDVNMRAAIYRLKYDIISEIFALFSIIVYFISGRGWIINERGWIIVYGALNMLRLCSSIAYWKKLFSRREKNIKCNYLYARLIKLSAIAVVGAHVSACIFRGMAFWLEESRKENWMRKATSNLFERSLWGQYVASLYWSMTIMSTTGFGDIIPINTWEQIVILVFMLLNFGLGAYLVTSLGILFVKSADRIRLFRESIEGARSFARRANLPDGLRDQMLASMLSTFQREVEHKARKLVSQPILSKSSHYLFQKIPNIYLFRGVSTELLTRLGYAMKVEIFCPEDGIIYCQQRSDKLYILSRGELTPYLINASRVMEEIIPFDSRVFGHIGVIYNMPEYINVKSKGYSEVLSIERETFLQIIAGNQVGIMMANLIEHINIHQVHQEKKLLREMQNRVRSMESPPEGDNLMLKHLFENRGAREQELA